MKAIFGNVRAACGLLVMVAALGGVAFGDDEGITPAPELDPGSMASAMTLLTGGVLLLNSRRRRPK